MSPEKRTRCIICGNENDIGFLCQPCYVKLTAAKDSFRELDTCQTCKHSISSIGSRGSTDRACDLSDRWIVPSNGFCNQHTNLEKS